MAFFANSLPLTASSELCGLARKHCWTFFWLLVALPAGESVRTQLMVDPRTKSLVLNGNPGHLQFYSLQRDKLLYNVRLRKRRALLPFSQLH